MPSHIFVHLSWKTQQLTINMERAKAKEMMADVHGPSHHLHRNEGGVVSMGLRRALGAGEIAVLLDERVQRLAEAEAVPRRMCGEGWVRP